MYILLLSVLASLVVVQAEINRFSSESSFPRCKRETEKTVIRSTGLGQLKGKVLTSREGKEYFAFLGIPYAEKTERFEVAQPVKPWDGVMDALNYSSICPQYSGFLGFGDNIVGDEDCLYLNVFTPAGKRCDDESENLPVLFHIPGGAFISGASDFYDPLFLMDECIVYISVNYRLGALGFLTTNDDVVPGNLGLKDSLLALKWTNQNIEHFRGNKDAVTITGISAGAFSSSHFIASPAAKGLFHRVIAQSGSSLTPLIQEDSKDNAIKLGQFLGCLDEESNALKACLRSKSVEEIVSNQKKITKWIVDAIRFFPVVEPADAVEPFHTVDPYLRIKRGEGSRVPLITGVMKDEGILLNAYATLANKGAVDDLNKRWYEVAPIIYFYDTLNITEEERNNISDKIKEFYLGGKYVGPETAGGFTDSESDQYFNFGSWQEALLHSRFAPVYRYSMNFKGNYSVASHLFGSPEIVVSHGDDIQYLYKSYDIIPSPEPGSDSFRFSQNLIKLWVSFIKSGTPTDLFPNVETWERFTAEHPSTLILEFPAENVLGYKQERIEFWKNIDLHAIRFPGNKNNHYGCLQRFQL